MSSTQLSEETLARRLPLPLARLLRRAHNADTPTDRHLVANYLWEAALKLLASTAVVESAEVARGNSKIEERLNELDRPSLGHWWSLVRELTPILAESNPGSFADLQHYLFHATEDWRELLELHRSLREILRGKADPQGKVRLKDLFDNMITYRNDTTGHGAPALRPEEFTERMGLRILGGVEEMLERIDVLAGRRLLYVKDVSRRASGEWSISFLELMGEAPRRFESLCSPRSDPNALPHPKQVYLGAPSSPGLLPVLRSLQPFLVYDEDREDVLFYNGTCGKQGLSYLSYNTGEVSNRSDPLSVGGRFATRLPGEPPARPEPADRVLVEQIAVRQQTCEAIPPDTAGEPRADPGLPPAESGWEPPGPVKRAGDEVAGVAPRSNPGFTAAFLSFASVLGGLLGSRTIRFHLSVKVLEDLKRRPAIGPNAHRLFARAYRRMIQSGLRLRPAEVHRVCAEHDPCIPKHSYHFAFTAADAPWLSRTIRGGDFSTWEVCLKIATRLQLVDCLREAARRLALHHADAGAAKPLIDHLDRCRRLHVCDRDLLEASLRAHLAASRPEDFVVSAAWKRFLGEVPAEDLPSLFEVSLALGRIREAIRLASSDQQRRLALAACLCAHDLEVAAAAVPLAEALGDAESLRRLHERLGDLLVARGQFADALDHFTKAGCDLKVSQCHERMGHHSAALRTCPRDAQDRLVDLVGPCLQTMVENSRRDEYLAAVHSLKDIRSVLEAVRDPVPELVAATGSLKRHQDAILLAARKFFAARAEGRPEPEVRPIYLEWSRVEQEAGENAQAALLAEKGGDYLAASLLWEADEKYGEALRALGREAPRAEILTRMAELCQRGGDEARAGALYEQAGRTELAARAYRAGGQYAAAARCLRQHLGDLPAAESEDYAELMNRAGLAEEAVALCLEAVSQHGRNGRAVDQLRRQLRADPPLRISDSLRARAEAELQRVSQADRQQFAERALAWLPHVRDDVLARFAPAWGMDLGTSKCVVALYDVSRGEPVVCTTRGSPQFPSVLAFDATGNELVGLSAEDLLGPHIRAAITGSKRRMGTGQVYRMGSRTFRPEEVAARLVNHGKRVVEEFLREQVRQRIVEVAQAELGDVPREWVDAVTGPEQVALSLQKAVVTVPAYFGYNQKRATRDACEIAGIQVLRLIHEPTAACLAAGQVKKLAGSALVVDLGAGTLDLSYLTFQDKVYEVEQIFGHNEFGSADFDAVLADHLSGSLRALKGIEVPPRSLLERRIRVAAEQLKIQLSTVETASYSLKSFGEHGDVTLELSRAEFERLVQPQLQALCDTCRPAAACKAEYLLLVGAPMFSPIIRGRLEALFGMRATSKADPRTSVACGAAIQAAVLTGRVDDVLLLDAVPFSLGVKALEPDKAKGRRDKFCIHIPKDTTIPTEKKDTYTTAEDNQSSVAIEIFQGESLNPDDNVKIGHFDLGGIPPARAGVPQIEVTFSIDASSVLTVGARDLGTGKESQIKISDTTILSPGERAAMKDRFVAIRRLDSRRQELAALVQRLHELLAEETDPDCQGAAAEWRRRFEMFQRSLADYAPQASDQQPLFEMFNHAAEAENQLILTADKLRNLQQSSTEYLRRADQLNAGEGDYETSLGAMIDAGRAMELQLRQVVDERKRLRTRFLDWSAVLAGLALKVADVRRELVICHEMRDYVRALALCRELPPGDLESPLLERYLDCLAQSHDRTTYLRVLTENGPRLGVRAVDFNRLNDFCKDALPALAWIKLTGAEGATSQGSGFLVADQLVATNRHVLAMGAPQPRAALPEQLRVHLAGSWRTVETVVLPHAPELDLALLRLTEPVGVAPLRLGYSHLVELGERVLALGFPLAFGDSFDDNVLIDSGIINRFRPWPGTTCRVFEVGIRAAPGMSGGPLFSAAGEVVGVISFITQWSVSDPSAEARSYVGQASNALAIDPLRELIPTYPFGKGALLS
jgi:molecular chaperone DnaK